MNFSTLGEVTPGDSIRAEDWNALVIAVEELKQQVRSQKLSVSEGIAEQEKSFRPSKKINKICEPKTPGIKDLPWKEGNWILSAEDVVYSPATKTYKVTRSYTSSDKGCSWDAQLYGGAN